MRVKTRWLALLLAVCILALCGCGKEAANDNEGTVVVQETTEPAEETNEPVEETTAPVEETEKPALEPEESTEETEVPAEEKNETAEESAEPAKETAEPAQDTTAEAAAEKEEESTESSEEETEKVLEILRTFGKAEIMPEHLFDIVKIDLAGHPLLFLLHALLEGTEDFLVAVEFVVCLR